MKISDQCQKQVAANVFGWKINMCFLFVSVVGATEASVGPSITTSGIALVALFSYVLLQQFLMLSLKSIGPNTGRTVHMREDSSVLPHFHVIEAHFRLVSYPYLHMYHD